MKHASAALSPGRAPSAVKASVSEKEASEHVLDARDPNYDDQHDPTVVLGSFAPMKVVRSPRALKNHSLDEIKATIFRLVSEYLVNFDKEDFGNAIGELNDVDTCHEIPKILISKGLDCTVEKRVALSDLLLYLVNTSRVSPLQIQFAFGRLFNRLHDLMLDVPHAPDLLKEFLRRAVAGGYCDSVAAELMSQGADLAQHPEQVRQIRPQFSQIISDYLASNHDVEEAIRCWQKLESPEFGHEFIKRLVNAGIDRTNHEREAVSQLLAAISTESAINQVEIEKAFQSLLDGMEEIVADVPDIVSLLACFLARAVCDEVLTPSFLTRSLLGLGTSDLGKNAIIICQTILSFPSPGVFASAVWNPTNSSELKEVLNGIIRTYLCDSSQDLVVRIGSLPLFGPILIKRCFVEASSSDSSLDKVRRLLAQLPDDIVLKGMYLIRCRLPDLAFDVPDIKEKFQAFTAGLTN